MLLAVDIGNTNTAFGLARATNDAEMAASWRLASVRDRTGDEWFSLLSPLLTAAGFGAGDIDGMIVSSVVPAIGSAVKDFGRRCLGIDPIFVGSHLDLGIRLDVDNPTEVGSDRLVNCAYAFNRLGGPLIVVDLGTATKIEAVTTDGVYLGGVIAPGLGLSLDALATRAARLYAVELKLPERAIGRNTVAAVQSGVVAGHLSMIEGMVTRVAQELGAPEHVVLTGGFSGSLASASELFTNYVPDLTLRGLQFLYRRNCPTGL
jgi:type III pantothenate kinase